MIDERQTVSAVMDMMEPQGLGHELLSEWCEWVRDDNRETASWNVKPRVQKAHDGDMPERVFRVDRIVATVRRDHKQYWRVLARYYLGQMSIGQIARSTGYTEGWARTMLLAACGLVEMRWADLTPEDEWGK